MAIKIVLLPIEASRLEILVREAMALANHRRVMCDTTSERLSHTVDVRRLRNVLDALNNATEAE